MSVRHSHVRVRKVRREQRIIAIGGGKGGVGKSFVSANLGAALARSGREVLLLDADFGGANLHNLFGIARAEQTVESFIEGRVSSLSEVTIPTKLPGLSIISGTCDVLGSADLDSAAQRTLLTELGHLDVDDLLIDVGAGTSTKTLDLFNAADVRLIVITPEMTSAQNAYGFLKVAIYRRIQRALESSPMGTRLIERLGDNLFEFGSTMERVESFMSMLAHEGPEIEPALRMLLREFNAKIVGNMLTRDADRNVLFALKRLIQNFLGLDIDVVAAFRSSTKVRTSVNTGTPIVLASSTDTDTVEFQRLARSLSVQDLQPLKALREDIAAALSDGTQQGFEFGLDGVEVLEVSEVTDPDQLEALAAIEEQERRDKRPSDHGPGRFVAELGRVTRSTDRGAIHAQLQLGGHWYLGELRSIGPHDAVIAGVHPLGTNSGVLCAFRLVVMDEDHEQTLPSETLAILDAYDDSEGLSMVRFKDPTDAEPFVSFARDKWERPAA